MRISRRMGLLQSMLLALCCTAVSQQPIVPSPRPADSGPSLAVTMQFIQTKLNELGKVNFAVYQHDSASDKDVSRQFSSEASSVVADAASCRISYHYKFTMNGSTDVGGGYDHDTFVPLSGVQDLVVRTGDQDAKRSAAARGLPIIDHRFDPPIFVLTVRSKENGKFYFYFFDEDMANRVAKAMTHAVDLCGGGSKDPF